jgi:hypothetical protein
MTMRKWQGARVRTPYEKPRTEQLLLRFDEQFMQSTFNSNNNEVLNRGLDEDFD